jgi:hypothetical protein
MITNLTFWVIETPNFNPNSALENAESLKQL